MAPSTSTRRAYLWPLLLNLPLVALTLVNYVPDPNPTGPTLLFVAGTGLNLLGAVLMLALRKRRVAAWFGGFLLLMQGVVGLFFYLLPQAVLDAMG
ncbi:MAG: hypothetical protein ACRYFX_23890 [Janthinobacterium lividum]